MATSAKTAPVAFTRERRAFDKAQRAAFVDHVGDHYGLEVDEPSEREPSPLRAFFTRKK